MHPAAGPVVAALGSNSRALWYLTRGSGVVALVLLTAVLLLGLLTVGRWSRPGWPRFLTADLHRNLSLLVVAFVALHVLTAVGDTFAPIALVNAFVPFTASYRSLWLGLGAVGFDLLIALVVTSLLRTRIPHRAWRSVHWLAYACWPVSVLHGLGTGSDVGLGWYQLATWGCVVVVVGALVWRLATDRAHPVAGRLAAAAGAVLTVLAIAGFTAAGPLRPGWARRAGTPANLLSHAAAPGASSASPAPAAAGLQLPYSGAFTGTVSQTSTSAGAEVVLSGTVAAAPSGRLRIELDGRAQPDGGVSMTSSRVSLTTGGSSWTGQVSALSGGQIQARIVDASGRSALLRLDVSIDGASATGEVRVVTG